jgi:Ca2+-binding EF-hand superfamily protein
MLFKPFRMILWCFLLLQVCSSLGFGNLINFSEVLSEKTYTGPKLDKGKMRVMKIASSQNILNFILKDCGVVMKMPPSSEDIIDGEEKNVLGLVFSIMMKYMKIGDDDSSSLSARDALLMWIQNKVNSYGLEVTNFGSSFHSGLVLCALVHKHRERLINYDALDKTNRLACISAAMDAANKYFALEKYITPEEFLKLDENGMFVYVSEYYYGIAEQRKLDMAARRITKVIKFTITCDNMRADFAKESSQFKERLLSVEKVLEDRTIDNTMAGAKHKIEEFYSYKHNDKNVLLGLQINLEGIYNNLSMLLANNKRPEFIPPQGLSLEDIGKAMEHLEQVELERNIALHAEYNRQLQLIEEDKNHLLLFQKLNDWINLKTQYLNTKAICDSVGAARFAISTLDAFVNELGDITSTTVKSLQEKTQYLLNEHYEKGEEIAQREQSISAGVTNVGTLSEQMRPVLEDDLARETFRENLRIEVLTYFQKVQGFEGWANEKSTVLAQRDELLSCALCAEQISLLNSLKEDLNDAQNGYIVPIDSKANKIITAKYETQYSSYEYEDKDSVQQGDENCSLRLQQLHQEAGAKEQYLNECLVREEKKEELRLKYAIIAGEMERMVRNACDTIAIEHFGFTLEDVEAYGQNIAASDASLIQSSNDVQSKAAAVKQEMDSLQCFDNPFTQHTPETLAELGNQLLQALENRRQAYQAELQRQQYNDQLCRQFAAAADPIIKWINERKSEISHSKGLLREQLGVVEQFIASSPSDGEQLNTVNQLQGQLDGAGITNNKHTPLSAKDIEVQWAQYTSFLEKKKQMLLVEIEHEECRGINPEQFKEIEENFKLFDKNGDQELDVKELKTCLYSLGEEMKLSQVQEIAKEYGNGSIILYEGFKKFMIHVLGDTDTKEEIISGFELIARGDENVSKERMEMVMTEHDIGYVIKTSKEVSPSTYDYKQWVEDIFSR